MHGRKNIRLRNYDYSSNGYYFVTAVTTMRNDIFLGKENFVKQILEDVIHKCEGVGLDYFVIMPNHVHIIFQFENSRYPLGEIVRHFKAKVSQLFGQPIWQANYYEHVIRNDLALHRIREYIENNPIALELKFDEIYGDKF